MENDMPKNWKPKASRSRCICQSIIEAKIRRQKEGYHILLTGKIHQEV
jgi:hypothetical protein